MLITNYMPRCETLQFTLTQAPNDGRSFTVYKPSQEQSLCQCKTLRHAGIQHF